MINEVVMEREEISARGTGTHLSVCAWITVTWERNRRQGGLCLKIDHVNGLGRRFIMFNKCLEAAVLHHRCAFRRSSVFPVSVSTQVIICSFNQRVRLPSSRALGLSAHQVYSGQGGRRPYEIKRRTINQNTSKTRTGLASDSLGPTRILAYT
jgi:hypothetical protein